MKTVIILRHAKAAAGTEDHERPLTPRGIGDAARAGALIKAAGLRVHWALVSDARRTRETYDGVASVLSPSPTLRIEPRLYEASVDTILDLIRETSDEATCLLLVGHNPGISEAARRLATHGPEAAMADLRARFATGTSAVVDLPITHWADLSDGTLRDLLLVGSEAS